MEIYFDAENATLKIKWLANNSCLSEIDYIQCWVLIQKHAEELKPNFLIIEMKEFEYRRLPEVNAIFNTITENLTPQNIAIVKSNKILGNKTLENLLNNCPKKGHKILENERKY